MKRPGIVIAVVVAGVLGIAIPSQASASVGVGVSTGKIDIREKIKSGSIYKLPQITVINTGTEKATYTMAVTFNEKQKQYKPSPNWFTFSPDEFSLEPGGMKSVKISLHPPLNTPQGDYFAYLEAKPSQTVKQGSATVGVAAASKLNFSVNQTNIFLAIWYRIVALFRQAMPWSLAAVVLAGVMVVYLVSRRFIKIKISRV